MLIFDDNIISEMRIIGPYLNFVVNREFLAKETLKTIQEQGKKLWIF